MMEKKRILLIEDDIEFQNYIVPLLEEKGCTVVACNDGASALQKIKEGPFNLIVLDLVLPDVDGFEFLRMLKRDQTTSVTPIVILTNLGQRDERNRAKKLGVTEYLVKSDSTPRQVIDEIMKYCDETTC